MKIFQNNGLDLGVLADHFNIAVEQLIALDNEGETRYFADVFDCFHWKFIDDSSRDDLLDVLSRSIDIGSDQLASSGYQTVGELLISDGTTYISEDGTVAFVYL